MRCQLVLDHALTALAKSRDAALQATITAETPTLEGLCAALDALRGRGAERRHRARLRAARQSRGADLEFHAARRAHESQPSAVVGWPLWASSPESRPSPAGMSACTPALRGGWVPIVANSQPGQACSTTRPDTCWATPARAPRATSTAWIRARSPRAPTPLRAWPHSTCRCPRKAGDPMLTLRMLDEFGSPATMAMAGPRFFGFVIGGALPVTLAAQWLASAWDQNSALHRVSPGTAVLEQVALRWLLDVLQLPPECAGAFVTGATVANLSALAAARHAVLARAGWDVEAQGLFGAPPVTVVVGEEAHPSLTKSLGILGFGRNRALKVPVDGQGRMRADRLPALSGPAIVCVQAGNVNTGAFDPVARGVRACARGRRLGARGRRVWPVGRGRSVARAPGARHRERRLMGDRCAQVAQRALRQRARVRARRERAACRDGHHGRLPAHRIRASQPGGLHARVVAPRARRGGLGGAAVARPRRPVGDSSSATARRRGGSRRRSRPRASRSSTRWCSTRCWCRSATRRARCA